MGEKPGINFSQLGKSPEPEGTERNNFEDEVISESNAKAHEKITIPAVGNLEGYKAKLQKTTEEITNEETK